MEERQRYEAEVFNRLESRLVAVEVLTAALNAFRVQYQPLVDALVTDVEVEKRVKEALRRERSIVLTRVQVTIAILALCIPSVLTYVLVQYAGK